MNRSTKTVVKNVQFSDQLSLKEGGELAQKILDEFREIAEKYRIDSYVVALEFRCKSAKGNPVPRYTKSSYGTGSLALISWAMGHEQGSASENSMRWRLAGFESANGVK